MKKRICILGAGAWGTALATAIHRAGAKTTLWGRNYKKVARINQLRENPLYLPSVALNRNIQISSNLRESSKNEILLLAISAQETHELLIKLAPLVTDNTKIILCSKGIDLKEGKFLHELAMEVLPKNLVAVLSGPSFAKEVGADLPTFVQLAAKSYDESATLAATLSSKNFTVEPCDDMIGLSFAGAVKNVIAIGYGMLESLENHANLKAAFLSDAICQMIELGKAMGAKTSTLLNRAGIGDLLLTCSNMQSRNLSLGYRVVKGLSPKSLLNVEHTIEGMETVKILRQICRKFKIDMPFCDAVYEVLYEEKPIKPFAFLRKKANEILVAKV